MSQTAYRRRAILTRIRQALDAFYLLQRIDWEFDVRGTLERILATAIQEIELDGGKFIERALLIVEDPDGGTLEAKAGYKTDDEDLGFSRTVVLETIATSRPILCENAKDDPRFMEAESLKGFQTLSLISVPLALDGRALGALYVESKSPGRVFGAEDLEFLGEFSRSIAPYLKVALTHSGHVRKIRRLEEEVSSKYSLGNLIGRSDSIRSVFELIQLAAEVDRTVLITGESGCGKELVARAIHYNGTRRQGAFVVVDCSSLAEHLLESELFGHRKGAFTGASTDKIGAFEEAHGGTIFLDEISDASKPLQQKLRRVLQEGEIRRVGDNEMRKVDVRIICATNKELSDLVARGEFIRDLYFRVHRFPIRIPPLRERREDIPLLASHFLEQYSRGGRRRELELTPEAVELLVSLDWKENNIRELRNTVELAADFADTPFIDRTLIERVLRIQHSGSSETTSPIALHVETESAGLVSIDRPGVRRFLEESARERDGNTPKSANSKNTVPFYRLQLEFSARLMIEGLRASDWKLRPAARLLGVSPTKLRGEIKQFLSTTLGQCRDPARAATVLDIPEEVLRRKAVDLGFEDLIVDDPTIGDGSRTS
jgi:Nif-specific regulatory protein